MSLRDLLYACSTGRSNGQQACLPDPRMPSALTAAAANGIAERKQTKDIGEAKMSPAQITGPAFLAVKRHPAS
jgi:hypothetical protein